MKAQGGYPANRRASAANNFTPALNNIMGPQKPFSLPKRKKAPGNNYKVPKTPKVSGLGWGG